MTSNHESPSATRYLVDFPAGETIFQQGDPGDDMFIIHEGEVEILHEGGPDQLAILKKGDFFGEMSLLEELPRVATARAVTDVKLVKIDSAAFDKILRKDPEIAIRVMRKLSGRLRETDSQLRALEEAPVPVVEPPDFPLTPTLALVHAKSGSRFDIKGPGVTSVGRGDPVTGFYPDIDLGPVDPDRSSSRRHAKLYYQDGAMHLVEEIGTTNGTFVRGDRLEAGQPIRVAAGDEVRFGLVELVLTDDSDKS